MRIRKIVLFTFLLAGLFYSCQTSKKVVYVQNAGTKLSLNNSILSTLPELVVKNGDALLITISTLSPEAAVPFNPPLIADPSRVASLLSTTSAPTPLTYLVDNQGCINFPVIGKVFVVGLSKSEVEELIRTKIYPKYITENPIVTMRIISYRVSVMGEVAHPGVISASNERISIFEAIASAGDLTIYGRRDNVLLIRENLQGKRETYRIDLRDKNLVDSPYFYLQQNDVLYIQPNNSKTRSSSIGSGEYLMFTVISSLMSITYFVLNLVKK